MIGKIRTFFSKILLNMKLRQKLLLSYIVLILLPLGLFSIYTYEKFSGIIEKYVLYSTDLSYDQSYSYISDKLNAVYKVINIITQENLVVNVLSRSEGDYSEINQLEDMVNLRTYLTSLERNYDFYRVRLYLKSGLIYSDENRNLFNKDKAADTLWYKKLVNSKDMLLWCPYSWLEPYENNNVRLLSAARVLKSPNDYTKIAGFLRVDLDESMFQDIITRANSIRNSLTFIINSKGDIITASDQKQSIRYLADARKLTANASAHLTRYQSGDTDIFARSARLPNTNWYIITIIPVQDIFAQTRSIRNEIMLLLLITTTIAYAFATYIAYSITKRISMVIKKMKNIQNGTLTPVTGPSTKDEIGELISNYNFMVNRISLLVEEQYKAGIEIKSAELKTLQAQINPHFLYNTLDMINSLTQQNRLDDIETAVNSLARFYKLSLSKGRPIVSIKDELQHVSFYVRIQNIRYPDRIRLQLEVDEDILPYSVPKITLQPLVENSIVHGILANQGVGGCIRISGKMENEIILLTVQDDGVGIPEDVLSGILSNSLNSHIGSGFGIKNINDRIKLTYGNEYGITFRSEYHRGTVAEIRIPALLQSQDHP